MIVYVVQRIHDHHVEVFSSERKQRAYNGLLEREKIAANLFTLTVNSAVIEPELKI